MKKWIVDIVCVLLILLWVYAASSKLFNYSAFREQLTFSPFLRGVAKIVSIAIPAAELLATLLLTVMNKRIYGLLASLILLIVFTGYIAGMLLSGVHLPCSCGGVISSLSWKGHLAFNLFFLAITIVAILLEKKPGNHELQTERST